MSPLPHPVGCVLPRCSLHLHLLTKIWTLRIARAKAAFPFTQHYLSQAKKLQVFWKQLLVLKLLSLLRQRRRHSLELCACNHEERRRTTTIISTYSYLPSFGDSMFVDGKYTLFSWSTLSVYKNALIMIIITRAQPKFQSVSKSNIRGLHGCLQ